MSQNSVPPSVPEDERMTDAEFKVVREYLGLTLDWLADHLNVSSRTVRHWEAGKYPIPDGVRLAMEDLERRTGEFVAAITEKLLDLPEPGVITYRNDADYHAAHPEVPFPAAWHRAVIARAAQDVPGLSIVYTKATGVDGPQEPAAPTSSGRQPSPPRGR